MLLITSLEVSAERFYKLLKSTESVDKFDSKVRDGLELTVLISIFLISVIAIAPVV